MLTIKLPFEIPYGDKRLTCEMTNTLLEEQQETINGYFAGLMTERADPHFRAGYVRFNPDTQRPTVRCASYDEHVAIAWAMSLGMEKRRATSLSLTGFIQAFQLNRPFLKPSDDNRHFQVEDRLIFNANNDEWLIIIAAEVPERIIYEGDYWCYGWRPDNEEIKWINQGTVFSIEEEGLPTLFQHGKPNNLLKLIATDPKKYATPSADQLLWEKKTWNILGQHQSRWEADLEGNVRVA